MTPAITPFVDPTLFALVIVQMTLGIFDVLFHHEFTERLAWKASQKQELRLHAVRNGFYALLFASFAWTYPTGWIAIALIAVLAAEILITLWDFVEEDMTRMLPASERVTHTLLALNYGAILVLLTPELIKAASAPTSITPVNYGLPSYLLSFAAVGVALFGLRDWFAATRSDTLALPPAAPLMSAIKTPQRILITGATGFIGRRLSDALLTNGHTVTALVRNPLTAKLPAPIMLIGSLDQIAPSARFDTVINLAGAPISGWLWTRSYRHRVLRSRLKTTRDLVHMFARLETKPALFISGSAIGYYGNTGATPATEAVFKGEGFATTLTAAWEAEADRANAFAIRTVKLRTGLVLGHDGGMLARLLPAFDLGIGGRLGNGKQWMSCITRDDLVRLIAHIIVTPSLKGPLNATAPTPCTNHDFTRTLAATLRRPAFLPLPAFVLSTLGGAMARDLMLTSQRVVPTKALQSGFVFEHATINAMLQSILKQPPHAARATPSSQAHNEPAWRSAA